MKLRNLFENKTIFLTVACTFLLSLFCVVKICMPNQEYKYEGQTVFEEGTACTEAIIYEYISLPAGVYDVVLEYQTDTNMKNLCTVADETVFSGGLLTNGEHLYQNLNHTDYRLWLLEGTEQLKLCIAYGGEGSLLTGNLTLRETDALWTILLTIIWSVAFCVICILLFVRHDRTVGVEPDQKTVIVGLAVIVLTASLPFLQDGIMGGADLVYHLMRIEGVKDGILSGQFPLRIEPEWLFGHGYANSIFYCNTLLYIPAILRLLGFTVETAYKVYCILINVATVWIGYFCFSRIFRDRMIGLLCTALHTLSVFRIYNFVVKAALGEGSAFTFMPLILYGLYRVFSEEVKGKNYQKAWIPIAIGYAGLMQTHVLSCEISAFLTIIVCGVFIKKIFVKETFLVLAKGALAAVTMSCWYLIPFLDYFINEDIHMHYVSARTIQDRGLYLPVLFFNWWKLGNNAVMGDSGMAESHAMGIGMILGIGFAVFCVLWFSGKWQKEKSRITALGKVSCILGGLLMLMSLNLFPWDRIQNIHEIAKTLVSSIQFPYRFLGWGTIFLVIVWGCLLSYFQKNEKKWHYYLSIVCILAGLVTSGLYLTDYICRDKTYMHIYNEEGMGFGYISGAEYIIEGTDYERLAFAFPVTSNDVEISEYRKEYLHMWLSCTNRGNTEGCVELPLLHYTGYRAYDTSSGEELEVMCGTNNVVRVLLPAGFEGEVEVKFVSPIHWRIGEGVTYLWYFSMAVLFVLKHQSCGKGFKINSRKRVG